MATITVTDGDERASLAVVRSLGGAGHTMHVVSTSGCSLAGASRHCLRETRCPDPLVDPEAFRRSVREVLGGTGSAALVPVTEASLLAVLEHPEAWEGVIVPFPSLETFRRVADKSEVVRIASELGIPQPTLAVLRAPSDVEPWLSAGAPIEFPAVLKSARSVVGEAGGRRKAGVAYVDGPAQLRRQVEVTAPDGFPLLLQRKLVGPGVGVFLLLHRGEVLARFAHRRLREKPPSGGVSVLSESVEVPEELVQASALLLGSLGWEGVAMVEYKVDAASGVHYLMEINGRFWGSLQLAIDAGVDFPRLLVSAAMGESLTRVETYRVGSRLRWFWGDVDHLLERWQHSREALGLPPSAPGRWGASFDFLRGGGSRAQGEVLRRGDARPALRETLAWFRDLVR